MHNRTATRTAHLQLRWLLVTAAVIGMLAPAQRAGAQQAEPPRFEAALSTLPKAPQAIDHTDAYYTRLTIHRYASYAMLPLFGAEYLIGQKLINGGDVAGWVKPAHVAVAGTIGALFVVNTVTGAWNLYDARKDPDKVRRYLHAALMLAADAGILYTASIAEGEDDGFGGVFGRNDDNTRHRNAALASFGVASAGTIMMWLWK
ncbi:MAG TPA: hypothetical protein VF021_03415 [Longimicrobiales bacterium]